MVNIEKNENASDLSNDELRYLMKAVKFVLREKEEQKRKPVLTYGSNSGLGMSRYWPGLRKHVLGDYPEVKIEDILSWINTSERITVDVEDPEIASNDRPLSPPSDYFVAFEDEGDIPSIE